MSDKIEKLLAKAATDPKFRAELLKNTASVVEKETGIKIPQGVAVKVLEDGPGVAHLVLPATPQHGVLSDKELGEVAGGVMPTFVCGGATWTQYRVC